MFCTVLSLFVGITCHFINKSINKVVDLFSEFWFFSDLTSGTSETPQGAKCTAPRKASARNGHQRGYRKFISSIYIGNLF